MLTYTDAPTIRNAIIKRLDKEPGVEICEIIVMPHIGGVNREDPERCLETIKFLVAHVPIEQLQPRIECISVGVLARLGHSLVTRSRFELPPEFTHQHLINEVDEIAEQYKAARLDFWGRGAVMREPEKQLAGTGLRGRWTSYG